MAINVYLKEEKIGTLDLNQSGDAVLTPISDRLVSVRINECNYQIDCLEVNIKEKLVTLRIEGKVVTLELKDAVDEIMDLLGMEVVSTASSGDVIAPMPGKVIDILVNQGESVEEGSPLVILEAMKMENILKAGGVGTVEAVNITVGETVEKGALLISMEK